MPSIIQNLDTLRDNLLSIRLAAAAEIEAWQASLLVQEQANGRCREDLAAAIAEIERLKAASPVADPWRCSAPSGLPFWNGGFRGLEEMVGLLDSTWFSNGRRLDAVLDYDAAAPPNRKAEHTIRGWTGAPAHRFLSAGRARAFVWTIHPWSGGGYLVANEWPMAGQTIPPTVAMCPNRPPGYTGNESADQRNEMQLRVWQFGADGHMDVNWRSYAVAMKRDFFLASGLQDVRLIFRAAHELDLLPTWGVTSSPRCNSICQVQTPADMAIVKRALERCLAVFLDVFGKVQPEIPDDRAWPAAELWGAFNPVKENTLPPGCDIFLACPDNAKLVGPDFYDHWRASMTPGEFAANVARNQVASGNTRQWHKGLEVWANWCRANGRQMFIPEWGVWSENATAEGIRPHPAEGWDNAIFIRCFLDWCRTNADVLAMIVYFNVNITKTQTMPGHYIAPWPGVDDEVAPAARVPIGDVNRLASRAFRRWFQGK